MIRQNLRLVLNNVKFLMVLCLIFLFTGLLLIYQEKNAGREGQARCDALEWALEQNDPAAAVSQRIRELLVPEDGQYKTQFMMSFYDEYMLLLEVQEYIERQMNYSEMLEELLRYQQGTISAFPEEKDIFVQCTVTYRLYVQLRESDVRCGNYLTYENFFAFGLVDFVICIVIFCVLYFLVLLERERGMTTLLFATRNGGVRYFYAKAGTLILIMSVVTLLLLVMKFWIYGMLYGIADASVAVQSMEGYMYCPFRLTIVQYICIYVLWKLVATALLAVGGLLVASLPFTEAFCGFVLMALVGVFSLLLKWMPHNGFGYLLRDSSIFQLWNAAYWFQGFRYYSLGSVGNTYFQLCGVQLPLQSALVFAVFLFLLGSVMYYCGLRKSGGQRFLCRSPWRYGSSLLGNELLFVNVYKKVIVIAIILLAAIAGIVCSFEENKNQNVKYQKQLVTLLNDKYLEDAGQWLEEKQKEYAALEELLINSSIQVSLGEMTVKDYDRLVSAVSNQLAVKPIVDGLSKQYDELMEYYQETGIVCQFEFQYLTDEIYGEAGSYDRLMLSIIMSIFISFSILTVFPADRQLGMHRVIGATCYGEKGMRNRTAILLLSVFLMSVLVYGMWLLDLRCQYGRLGLDSALPSIRQYREASDLWFAEHMTVGHALIGNVLWQSAKWTLLAAIGLTASFYITNVIWAELLGVVLYLCPVALGLIGATWVTKLCHYGDLVIFERDVMLDSKQFLIVGLGSLVVLVWQQKGRKRWMEM